jgi:hypothetical protein
MFLMVNQRHLLTILMIVLEKIVLLQTQVIILYHRQFLEQVMGYLTLQERVLNMATRISDDELDAYLLNAAAGDVRQSSTVGTLSSASGNDTSASTAPPNAKAAPTGSSTEKILGLCEALNQYEQQKVRPD